MSSGDADEQLFPIDIHYYKLIDWLVDRRHCDLKWLNEAREIQGRVKRALGDLPEQIKRALHVTDLHYYDCIDVVERLKVLDGDEKTLFGQYNSPRLKEWADILKQYEKKNIYLAECAQILIRNVKYEVPALRQQISKCHSTQRDCERKEGECLASVTTLRNKFQVSCKEMNISGERVREELRSLVNELPGVYRDTMVVLPSVMDAMAGYEAFTRTIHNRRADEKFLPMLSYILKHGNVTVYEWKHGNPPPEPQVQCVLPSSTNTANEGALEIDWGGDLEAGQDGAGEEVLGVDTSGFDIVVEESGTTEEITAVDPELQPLLESPQTRNLLLNDLMELKEFLSQRMAELTSNINTVLGVEQFNDDVTLHGVQSGAKLQEMLDNVTKVMNMLTNARVQHLFLIKGSPRYLDRLSQSLLQHQELANRAASQADVYHGKGEEAGIMVEQLEPQLAVLVQRTKHLQGKIAADISRRYNNRVVNIMGEINQL
ncbi:hypothetical protein EMCRGX_G004141 [Ephydatia muelleri]|eukprot:Em0007g78a